jgi:cobalt/nickel transport system permease protein
MRGLDRFANPIHLAQIHARADDHATYGIPVMHIPDGFLSPPVWLTLDVLAVPATSWVARRASRINTDQPDTSRIPLLGIMGAFVFAAQTINFPIGLGTSGHLLGGTLLGGVLGPAPAALVLTAVLILQALLFQDGGVLALGANIFNMALAGVAVGYLPILLWGRRPTSLFFGGLFSVLASGALAAAQLTISGIAISGPALTLAAGLFAVTGLLEGAITVAAFRAIARIRPQSLHEPATVSRHARLAIAATALLLVTTGVWFASAAPDNLQSLAANLGLQDHSVWSAPFPGYEMSVFGNGWGPEWLRKPAAGLIGIICVYGVCLIGGKRRQMR